MPDRLPKAFVEGSQLVAVHRDPQRWDLMYRLLWRLSQGDKQLMDRADDSDVQRFMRLVKVVRQDVHNCHAYVRFRPAPVQPHGALAEPEAEAKAPARKHYVAWYEPDHLCLPLAVPHFVERLAAMDWTLFTPDATATFAAGELQMGPGVRRDPSLSGEDAIDAMWRTYYVSIFNPARLNTRATRQHMPQRFWKNMPETQLIPHLSGGASAATQTYLTAQPEAAAELPAYGSLADLATDLRACVRCPWAQDATQAVPGEGHVGQALMVVGEQPGDMEDRVGRPFVGPAGELFSRALQAAGIDRADLFITNAVKHFKFELRGKRRIHQKPNAKDVGACNGYLAAELALVRPQVLLCLGTTAALAVFGKAVKLKDVRAQVLPTAGCAQTFVTTHPSAILRMPPEAQEAAMTQFVNDLKQVRALIAS